VPAAAEQATTGRSAADALDGALDVADGDLPRASARFDDEERARRAALGVAVAGVLGLGVAAGRRRARAGIATVEFGAARDGRLEDGATAVADQLIKGGGEAGSTRSAVVGAFADVALAAKRSTTDEVTDVQAEGIIELEIVGAERRALALLALAGGHRGGLVGERAALANADVAAAVAHRSAGSLAQSLALGLGRLGTRPRHLVLTAAADDGDGLDAGGAGTLVAERLTGMTAGELLGAQAAAGRDRI
jgi:hypothetical protein